jgi:hypothetical protein
MRMLLSAEFPLEPFNTLVRTKKIGPLMERIMQEIKPEATYFTEQDGKRGCICVVNVADPSMVPKIAEPLFLSFNAEVRFRVAMSPEELAKANLESLGDKWA